MHSESTIKCCYKCVPPKRHLGCHETCEEYLKEKEEWNKKKEEITKIKTRDRYFKARRSEEKDISLKKLRDAKYMKANRYK